MKTTRGFYVIIIWFIAAQAYGQNADSLFKVAQQSAYAKDYAKAQHICRQLMAQFPANPDYKILLGRSFAWEGKNDSAKLILKQVIETNAANAEAYDALTDAELWSRDYKSVIEHCSKALTIVKANEKAAFQIKQAKAYDLLEDYAKAKTLLAEVVNNDPANTEAKQLLDQVKSRSYKNAVSASYLNVAFSNPGNAPWHYSYLEYKRNFKKCPLLARVNYANTEGQEGYQFEADAYPKLGKGTYAYLNAGYSSSNDLFPGLRAGADVYQKLVRGFELSAGARYLRYSTEDVLIYTVYAGKYYKNLWFAYRPFAVAKDGDVFFSHTGTIRKYFSDPENYISLNLIYGATPYTTASFIDINKINSRRIGIDFQYKAGKSFLVKPMFSYEYEEYFPGLFRNRFYSQLILIKRF